MLQDVLNAGVKRFGPQVACEVSLAFVSPAAIANLNHLYRGKHGATDVLSFSFISGRDRSTHSRNRAKRSVWVTPLVLGEVIIAPAIAATRAKRFGHSLALEIGLLFVHGLLHVLGLEHEGSAAAKTRMRHAEATVIKSVPALARVHSGQGLLVRELVHLPESR